MHDDAFTSALWTNEHRCCDHFNARPLQQVRHPIEHEFGHRIVALAPDVANVVYKGTDWALKAVGRRVSQAAVHIEHRGRQWLRWAKIDEVEFTSLVMIQPDCRRRVRLLAVSGKDELMLLIGFFGGRYRSENELGRESPHSQLVLFDYDRLTRGATNNK